GSRGTRSRDSACLWLRTPARSSTTTEDRGRPPLWLPKSRVAQGCPNPSASPPVLTRLLTTAPNRAGQLRNHCPLGKASTQVRHRLRTSLDFSRQTRNA